MAEIIILLIIAGGLELLVSNKNLKKLDHFLDKYKLSYLVFVQCFHTAGNLLARVKMLHKEFCSN